MIKYCVNHLEYERYYESVGLRYKHEVSHPTGEGGNLGYIVLPTTLKVRLVSYMGICKPRECIEKTSAALRLKNIREIASLPLPVIDRLDRLVWLRDGPESCLPTGQQKILTGQSVRGLRGPEDVGSSHHQRKKLQ